MTEIVVPFEPVRRTKAPDRSAPASGRRPARIARTLALAHELQRRLDSGEFRNQAALARALGFSRERVSKLLELVLLAPDLQERILFLECPPGKEPFHEEALRRQALGAIDWIEQRNVCDSLLPPIRR